MPHWYGPYTVECVGRNSRVYYLKDPLGDSLPLPVSVLQLKTYYPQSNDVIPFDLQCTPENNDIILIAAYLGGAIVLVAIICTCLILCCDALRKIVLPFRDRNYYDKIEDNLWQTTQENYCFLSHQI